MEPAMTELRIASPCHEPWDAMTPHGEGRHCAACDKTVVDVTALAPTAARDFLQRELPQRIGRGERVCVRAHADRSGRLLRGGITRRLLTNGLAAVLAMAMADGIAGPLHAAEGGEAPVASEPVKGEMAPIAGGVQAMPQPEPQPATVQPLMGRMMAPPPQPVHATTGDVDVSPACLAVPVVAAVRDPASGLTISADPAAFLVIAARSDGGEAWRCILTDHGIPGDGGHLISALALDGSAVVVTYGPGGERLRLDARSGAARPR
jgi:hypothetical protein